MELEQTKIYPYVKNCLDLCAMRYFEPGDMVSRGTVEENSAWYVVKGIVETVATGQFGQRVHIDFIEEDDFAGKISHRFGKAFYCDDVAFTPCEILQIPMETFDGLVDKNLELERYFNQRCILKAYGLYKQALATRIFSQQQLLAAHIYTRAENSIYFVNIADACNSTNVSNRNLYNIIRKLEAEGVIAYKKPKTIFIKDTEGLLRIAKPVLDYYETDY